MIKFEELEVAGFSAAMRGVRNPMNSWDKSDSYTCYGECFHNVFKKEMCEKCKHCIYGEKDPNYFCFDLEDRTYIIGPNDMKLMRSLAEAGEESASHSKFRRMIVVYVDITAPLYWWKEFDTYKVGTVSNSCSTMHKIHAKEFTIDDFSNEHILNADSDECTKDFKEFDDKLKWTSQKEYNEEEASLYEKWCALTDLDLDECKYPNDVMSLTIRMLNKARELYLKTKEKRFWWQMIQLLPSSYNQKRTVMLNYEVLHTIYRDRKNHKLDEWRDFCGWINNLPAAVLITLK